MKCGVVLLLLAGVASAYVVGYHVEPVKASLSGLAPRYVTVSENITGQKRDTSPISSLKRVKPIDPAPLVPAA